MQSSQQSKGPKTLPTIQENPVIRRVDLHVVSAICIAAFHFTSAFFVEIRSGISWFPMRSYYLLAVSLFSKSVLVLSRRISWVTRIIVQDNSLSSIKCFVVVLMIFSLSSHSWPFASFHFQLKRFFSVFMLFTNFYGFTVLLLMFFSLLLLTSSAFII